jgi:hypothetical protein
MCESGVAGRNIGVGLGEVWADALASSMCL